MNNLEIGALNIQVNDNTVSKMNVLKVNGNIMTKVFFRQLPDITVEAAFEGNYLGVVNIEEKEGIISYLVILYDKRLYKGEKSGVKELICKELEKRKKNDTLYKSIETGLDNINNQLDKLYIKTALSSVLNKISHKEPLCILEENQCVQLYCGSDGKAFKIREIHSNADEVGVIIVNEIPLNIVLNEQLKPCRLNINYEDSIVIGINPTENQLNKYMISRNNLADKCEEYYNEELKCLITGKNQEPSYHKTLIERLRLDNKEELKQRFKEKMHKEISEEQYSSDAFIQIKFEVTLFTWDGRYKLNLGDVIFNAKLFDGSIKKISKLADKHGVTGADSELIRLKAQYSEALKIQEKYSNMIEDENKKVKDKFNSISKELNRISDIILLIGRDLA